TESDSGLGRYVAVGGMRCTQGVSRCSAPARALSSDGGPTLLNMPKRPTRIDLFELDIALRLADLWREAADVEDWNLDVVAAFMRAAYGKGYCDALTEEAPGSLCEDHGYRIPPPRPQEPAERAA